jgi:hypothetical protein
MAVVVVKYIRNRKQVKAHLRYITHRRGKEGEKITRTLFDKTGLTEKQASYQMIDEARRGTVFYKIMISPDPSREDTRKDLDLQLITRQTILKLEKQLGMRVQFVATVHDDHTDKRHVHGIFLISGRLTREEFKSLAFSARNAATQEARLQRKAYDAVRRHPRHQALVQSIRSVTQASGGLAPQRMRPGCRSCGYGELTGIPIYLSYCPVCLARLGKERTVSLQLGAGEA